MQWAYAECGRVQVVVTMQNPQRQPPLGGEGVCPSRKWGLPCGLGGKSRTGLNGVGASGAQDIEFLLV